MNASRDDATNENIMDLAMTLTSIDRGLVRITERPSADKISTFMLTMYTDHPFGQGDPLFKPLDKLVTPGTDFEAVNSPDAVLRIMQSQPFYFEGNEGRGAYFSEATSEMVMGDPKGSAILNRARKWREQQ